MIPYIVRISFETAKSDRIVTRHISDYDWTAMLPTDPEAETVADRIVVNIQAKIEDGVGYDEVTADIFNATVKEWETANRAFVQRVSLTNEVQNARVMLRICRRYEKVASDLRHGFRLDVFKKYGMEGEPLRAALAEIEASERAGYAKELRWVAKPICEAIYNSMQAGN